MSCRIQPWLNILKITRVIYIQLSLPKTVWCNYSNELHVIAIKKYFRLICSGNDGRYDSLTASKLKGLVIDDYHLSPSPFYIYKFRALVGTASAKYLVGCRMQEAVMLLEARDLSVEQIADSCGYSSHVAFRKAFIASTGTMPRQVRMGRIKT